MKIFKFMFTIIGGLCVMFLITTFYLWKWVSVDDIPNLISIEEAIKMNFDYIIVGGGTAGCVLATKLSEDKNLKILLIEAGDQFGILSTVPFLSPTMQRTELDWKMVSVPQKYSSRGLINQQQFLPRGKGLGGSSQMNFLLHFNGLEKDFDMWESLGATNWNRSILRKYIDKVNPNEEKILGDKFFQDNYLEPFLADDAKSCSLDQCMDINENNFTIEESEKLHVTTMYNNKLTDIIMDSVNELNLQHQNPNGLVFNLPRYNVKNGIRWGVYHSYLRTAFKRTNLRILLNTRVHKINFKNRRAASVKVSPDNQLKETRNIHVNKEIILSAGAFQTPQLLKLSGIGPDKELENLKIKSMYNSPNVGENLYDHLFLPLFVSINESISINQDKLLNIKEIMGYVMHGTGILSRFGVVGNVNVENEDHGLSIFGVGFVDDNYLKDISNYRDEAFYPIYPKFYNKSQEGFVWLSTCHQPNSRGSVKLSNRNVKRQPLINLNYLQTKYDVNCMIKAVRLGVSLIQSKAFQLLEPKIYWPKLKECHNFGPYSEDFRRNQPSDRYLECVIRTVALTGHHPGGSCSIGNTSNSCIDNDLRVNGVSGLRVVDASIMPTPVSGTTNTILVAMAEYASDIILNRRK